MVDEAAFRQELHATDAQACVFGKAVLVGCCGCALSRKRAIAEREAVHCTQVEARALCAELYGALRRNSLFALRLLHDDQPLTHAQNMKLQCGGLHGVQLALDGAEQVADVSALIGAACDKYGSLDELPYSQIVQSVSAFQVRKPHDKD